jgi:hypothetical protein
MNTMLIKGIFAALLMLGMAVPSAALADDAGKGCSLLGTWFGVTSPEDTTLTGWMVTVTGQSNNQGTNNLEFPSFDATLSNNFPTAVRASTLRGTWKRVGGNEFEYTMMGIAVDADGLPVWIGKMSGRSTLSSDCSYETVTATMEVFLPGVSPFDGIPYTAVPMPTHYGYRAYVDLP